MHNWRRYPSSNWYKSNLGTFRASLKHSCLQTRSSVHCTQRIRDFLLMRYINLRLLTYLLTKLTKNAVLNLALCCGVIWRHREKQQYRCTTTLPPVHNCQKYLGKFTSYMTFGAHKLVRSEPFLGSRCEIWHLRPALYRLAKCGKKII